MFLFQVVEFDRDVSEAAVLPCLLVVDFLGLFHCQQTLCDSDRSQLDTGLLDLFLERVSLLCCYHGVLC